MIVKPFGFLDNEVAFEKLCSAYILYRVQFLVPVSSEPKSCNLHALQARLSW